MNEKTLPSTDDDAENSEIIQNHYDWSSIAPSTAVIETITQAENCEQQELSPLYDVINPDAFDTVLASQTAAHADSAATISFTYTGYSVTVENTGTVHVHPAASA